MCLYLVSANSLLAYLCYKNKYQFVLKGLALFVFLNILLLAGVKLLISHPDRKPMTAFTLSIIATLFLGLFNVTLYKFSSIFKKVVSDKSIFFPEQYLHFNQILFAIILSCFQILFVFNIFSAYDKM